MDRGFESHPLRQVLHSAKSQETASAQSIVRGRADYTDPDVLDGHYSVVCWLDDKNIYIQDSETGGIRKLGREDFTTV